jgi:hypothetical protein
LKAAAVSGSSNTGTSTGTTALPKVSTSTTGCTCTTTLLVLLTHFKKLKKEYRFSQLHFQRVMFICSPDVIERFMCNVFFHTKKGTSLLRVCENCDTVTVTCDCDCGGVVSQFPSTNSFNQFHKLFCSTVTSLSIPVILLCNHQHLSRLRRSFAL